MRDLIEKLGTDGARAAAARLGKSILFRGVTLGAAQGALIPVAADAMQMAHGDRERGDFDRREMGLGLVAGAAAGAAGDFFGGRAIAGISRLVSKAGTEHAAGSALPGRALIRFAGAAAGGGAGAVAGVTAVAPFTGLDPEE
ncbi:hypothetical protein [Nocardia aurantia]|uniref:hypothetical protein n=1 Tax=Nocardia aurantia TaxID=2585199 RepID=UPI0012951026|nr:hypothetical protein [Nocardia aurantia]